jgi:hypothetical protein
LTHWKHLGFGFLVILPKEIYCPFITQSEFDEIFSLDKKAPTNSKDNDMDISQGDEFPIIQDLPPKIPQNHLKKMQYD